MTLQTLKRWSSHPLDRSMTRHRGSRPAMTRRRLHRGMDHLKKIILKSSLAGVRKWEAVETKNLSVQLKSLSNVKSPKRSAQTHQSFKLTG